MNILCGRAYRAALVLLSFSAIACSSSSAREDGDTSTASEDALATAAPSSVAACKIRFLFGDIQLVQPLDIPDACQADRLDVRMKYAASELSTLWRTRPERLCTWTAGHESAVCGHASPEGNAFYCHDDGSIAYDADFVQALSSKYGSFAVTAVFAHEWGHLNQHKLGYFSDPTRHGIQDELSADCQAGIYMGVEQLVGRPLTDKNARDTFAAFCAAGDPASMPWFDPQAHGTCEQREEAFLRGYTAALQQGQRLCAPDGVGEDGKPTGLAAVKDLCPY